MDINVSGAKQFKVLVNTGKPETHQLLEITQGDGERGQSSRIKAQAGVKYQLQDMSKARHAAPDYVKVKRVGKDLHIFFARDQIADLIIEDYYSTMPEGYNGVIGQAENGSFYEYYPEDRNPEGLIPQLADGGEAVSAVLGGQEVQGAGALVGVFAFGPVLSALGLAGAAAAAAGTGSSTVSPAVTTGVLAAATDTGTAGDAYTRVSKPQLTGKARAGATVKVSINNIDYITTADANGNYTVEVTNALPDGKYTPFITVTPAGGTPATAYGAEFTVDTVTSVTINNTGTAATLSPITGTAEVGDVVTLKDANGQAIGSAVADLNGNWSVTPSVPVAPGNITATVLDKADNTASASANNLPPVTTTTVNITGISLDSGVSSSDFITNDNNGLTVSGTLSAALTAGQKLWYSSDNGATWTDITAEVSGTAVSHIDNALTSTNTITMRVQGAGGTYGAAAAQRVTIDTTGPEPWVSPEDPLNPPAGKTSLTVDNLTADNMLTPSEAAGTVTITGTARGDFSAGDVVTLVMKGVSYSGTVNASGAYSIAVSGTDLIGSPEKTVNASLLAHDKSGNTGTITASKTYTLEGAVATTVNITGISLDSGVSSSDFITNDNNGLTVSGTLSAALTAGQKLWYSSDNGATWTDITAEVSGTAVSHIDNALTSTNTITMRVQGAGGTYGAAAAQRVTIDTDGATTQPGGLPDQNANATIDITAISDDSGASANDFVTNDKSLTYSGTVSNFTANGDKVKLELLAADGSTVIETVYQDVMGASSSAPGAGIWRWSRPSDHADGQYTLRATVVDLAGNRTNATAPVNGSGGGQDTQVLFIDTSATTNQPGGSTDPNSAANVTVSVTGIDDGLNGTTPATGSKDTGISSTDFLTADNKLSFFGSTANFVATNGAQVRVQILDLANQVLAEQYVTPDANGLWIFDNQTNAVLPDGRYTIKADIVDKPGNTVKTSSQLLIVKANADTTNATASVAVVAISQDTGTSTTDLVTSDNTLTFSGTVTGFTGNGDLVHMELLDKTGTTVLVTAYVTATVTGAGPQSGTWTWTPVGAQADGEYKIRATLVDVLGSRLNNTVTGQDTKDLAIDTSAATNQPGGGNDPNNNANVTIAIGGIDDGLSATSAATGSKDSGADKTDNITSDGTLNFSGTTANFNGAQGAMVHLQVFNARNVAVVDQYVTPDSTGKWTFNNQGNTLPDGAYTLQAAIEDKAGNPVKVATSVPLVIDSSGGTVQPSGLPDMNSAATVDITGMSTDSGVSATDYITNDNTLTYSGVVAGFTNNGDKVKLELLDADGVTVVATRYLVPVLSGTAPSAGTWSWAYETTQADGQYTLRATLVDAADNRVNSAVGGQDAQMVLVDTRGGTHQPGGKVNPNTTATIDITAITDDSGASASDFITSDTTLVYSGTVTGFTANGDKVKVELLAANGTTLIATAYLDVTVTSGNNGTWTWPYDPPQLQGNTSIRATLVDTAGNRVNSAAGGQDLQAIVIDTTGPAPVVSPEDPAHPPAGTTSLSVDDVTADNAVNSSEAGGNVTITGTVRGDFTANDGVILTIQGVAYSGTVNDSGVYSIPVSGADLLGDTDKTINATLIAHDKAGNPGTITATKLYTLENAVTTTVTVNAISLDTGTSSTDFVTKDRDGLTVTGTLSTALTAGQKLWYSHDNGATWIDISSSVSNTAVSYSDAALTSTSTLQMRVQSAGGNYGNPATQLVTIDATAPTFTSLATAPAVNENSAALTTVYTATATDARAVTYSLKAGTADGDSFSIDATTGVVKLIGSPDFETKASYSLTVVASDAAGNTSERVVSLAINNVNEAPISTVPGAQTGMEDVSKVIAGLSISDVDAGSNNLTVTLAVTHGTLTIDAASSGVTVATNNTASVTLTGSQAQINTLLLGANGVTYVPTANFNGQSVLTLTTNDGGNTGLGNALSDQDTVTINLAAVNDQPVTVALSYTGLEDNGGINLATAPVPTGSMGVLVSSLTDIQASSNDVDNTQLGLAITSGLSSSANGKLWYSTDNGSTWTDLSTLAGGNALSDTHALVLSSTARLYFQGNANVFGGSLATANMRLWDGTDNAASGSFVDVTARSSASGAYAAANSTLSLNLTAINDQPALSASATNPRTNAASKLTVFSNASADLGNTAEGAQKFSSMTLTVSGLANGANEKITLDGTDIPLVTGSLTTATTHGWTATVNLASGTATVILTHSAGATGTELNTLVDAIRYTNSLATPTDGDRVITITRLQDNGGTANGGDDTVALNIACTITLDTTASTTLATITAIHDDIGLIKGVIAHDDKTDDTSLNLNGSLSHVLVAGETLRIYDGSILLGTALVNGITWTFVDPRTLIDNQVVAYKAVVFDGLNEGAFSAPYSTTIDLTPPVITITSVVGDTLALSGTNNTISTGNGTYDAVERGTSTSTAMTLPVISGTTDAEVDQTVVVTLNGKNYFTTVKTGGNWSITLPNADAVALNHGNTLPIVAAVSDKAGLSGTDTNNPLVVNIASPDIPTVDNQFSSALRPTLTGSAQKVSPTPSEYIALATGDTLSVSVGSATYTGQLNIGAVNNGLPPGLSYDASTKLWSLNTATATPSSGALTLASGNAYDVQITVKAAGVTKDDISTKELRINTTSPVIVIETISGDSLIDASEKNTPLFITGTTDAEVGSIVTITGLDATPRTATVITGTGSHSGANVFSLMVPASAVSVLADKIYTVNASVTNVYGLSGTDTEPVTVDFVASTTTVTITAIQDDVGILTGVVAHNGRTDDAQPAVSGTLSIPLVAGEVVQVYDGSTLLGTATVTGTTWTFADPRTLRDAQKVTYTALVFDGANQGTVSNSYSATIDLTPPTVVNDINTAQEKGGANNTTAGIEPVGVVLSNDSAGANDSLSLQSVTGAGSAIAVAASGNTNIVGSYGTLTIAANGSYTYAVDQTQAAVQALKANSTGLSDVFRYTAKDLAGLTATATLTITVNGANDNATIGGTLSGAATEDASPNTASGILTVADVDAGEAVFQTPATLAGTYGTFIFNSTTGAWGYTLDNTKTSVQALAAGQQVTDTLVVKSQDGTATQNVTVTITGVNDAAVISGTTSGAVTEDASPNTASGIVTVIDVDTGQAVFQTPASLTGTYGTFTFNASTGAWGYTLDNSKPATQALAANQQVNDKLIVQSSDGSALQNIVVTVTGINDPATFSGGISKAITESNAVQTVNGTLIVADVDSAATVTAQTNVAGSAGLGKFSINSAGVWSYVMDTAQNQLKPSDVITDSLTVTSADGTPKVISVVITGTNDAPVLSNSAVLTYTEAQAATAINTLVTVSDADNSTQTSATVAITSGYVSSEDLLSFVGNSATMGNITGNYSAGVMGLVSAGGTASLAQWQTALQAVKYSNNSANPQTAARTVSYTLNDGALDSVVLTSTINLVSVNNAPVNTVPAAQTTLEDTAKVFSGLAIADADAGSGNMTVTLSVAHGIVNVATGAGVTLSSNGTPSAQLTGTVSAINALLLTTNAVTYTPTLNYNGSDTLTMLTSDNGNTSGPALSDTDTVAINVTAVNDAPVLAPTTLALPAVLQDSAVPAGAVGALVSALVGGVTDLDAAAVKGIAITGVANGTLYYSTNGGTNWTAYTGTASDSNALLLASDADNRIYFKPTTGYSGNANAVTFRAWDQTTGTQGSYVSSATNGSTTAFSSATDTISVQVVRPVTINTVSGDNMVAMNEAVPLTGTANPGATVSLSINGTARTVTADASTGAWSYNTKLEPEVRYVMVRKTIAGGDFFDLADISIKSGGTDIPRASMTVTAGVGNSTNSASIYTAVSTPANMIDGDTSSRYESGTAGENWVQVDLGGYYRVDSITLTGHTGQYPRLNGVTIYTSGENLSGQTTAQLNAATATVSNYTVSTSLDVVTTLANNAISPDAFNNSSNAITASEAVSGVTSSASTTVAWRPYDKIAITDVVSPATTLRMGSGTHVAGSTPTFNGVLTTELTGTHAVVIWWNTGSGWAYHATATVTGKTWTWTAPAGLMSTGGYEMQALVVASAPLGALVQTSPSFFVTLDNTAPVNTVPVAQTVAEDTPLAILGLSAADVDGNLSSIQLSVLQGTLGVTLSGAATLSAGGNNTATLTVSGSQADINATLVSLKYKAASNYNGADTLSVVSKDSANATDTDTVAITVTAVNDAPVNTVPVAQSTSTATAHTISGLQIADVDAGLGSMTITLAVGHGTIAVATSGTGIALGSNGTGSVTLTGTLSNLNSLLASNNAVKYTSAIGYNGTDTLTMTTNDNGNTGTGGPLTGVNTVSITVEDPLKTVACAALLNETMHTSDSIATSILNLSSFANATVKFYVGSTLQETATLNSAGSYSQTSFMTVTNGSVVHAEVIKNGVTYVIGGGRQVISTSPWSASAIAYATPLVLDLNGDGVQTTDAAHAVQFDLNHSGTPQKISWVDKHDGLLAIDLNGDGQINSGAELFGNHTQLANGTTALDGWAALGEMDSNHDGRIDAKDANFDKLRVWIDANGDGVTDAGELHTLADVKVASIDLNADNTIQYQNGNALQGFSSFTSTDGATHEMADVWLQTFASGVVCLKDGQALDLSWAKTPQMTGVDLATDGSANTVKLTLADVLASAATHGVHQLTLTGDANDTLELPMNEWRNSGNTVTEGGHTYAIYNASASVAAQLWIDQHMVLAHLGQ